MRFLAALLFICCSAYSHAGVLVTPANPVRVDFTLGIDETDPDFSLPAVLIDYTVEFERSNGLNFGEGYRTDTFTANGTFLGGDSYINTSFGTIIGCACTGGLLIQPLQQVHFYILLSSLGGTFEVTNVYALAYDAADGFGDVARAIGRIHPFRVQEPPTFALVLLAAMVVPLVQKRRVAIRRT